MPLKKHVVNRGVQLMQIHEYLENILENAGFAGVDLQKTPLGYRVKIRSARPGLVIGKKGVRIKELGHVLETRFKLDNPQIDVESIENPELNAQIMAEAIAFGLKKGQNVRRTAYSIMRRVIRSGARGVEVKISGKSTSQRARSQIFRQGIISKCGMPAIEGVDKGLSEVVLKSGMLGISVKIMPLDYKMPDEIILKDPENIKVLRKRKENLDSNLGDTEIIIDKSSSTIIHDETPEEESIFDNVDEGSEEVKEITEEEPVVEKKPRKKKTSKKSTKKSSKKSSKKKSTKKSTKKSSKKKSTKKSSKKKTSKKEKESSEEEGLTQNYQANLE